MPSNDEIRQILKEYTEEIAGKTVMARVEGMFTSVMGELSSLKRHVDTQIDGVRQEVKGVQARVTVLETTKPTSLAPKQIQAIETYTKSETSNVYKLTDFEMHELHAKAKRWDTVAGWVGKVSVIVAAAVVVSLLVWLGWIRK